MNPVKRVSRWIGNLYSTRLLFALLFIVLGFFWLFNFSSFPFSNPALVTLSGGEGLLDIRPFYSAQEAYIAMTRYGAAGRTLYLKFLAADFFFIPVYAVLFSLLMTRAVRAVCGEKSPWLPLNLIPLVIGFFDFAENLCILGILRMYPQSSFSLGTLSGIATLSKWVLSLFAILCFVYGGVVLLMRQFGFMRCAVHGNNDI